MSSQVDAVVGEQCEAILERLRVALGVGSIGEVEGAVMALLQPIPTLVELRTAVQSPPASMVRDTFAALKGWEVAGFPGAVKHEG